MPHFQQLLSTRNLLMLRFVSALFSPPPLLLVLLFLLFFFLLFSFFFSVFFNCGWLFVYCDWSPENNVTVLACSEAGKQRPAIITTIIRNKKNAPQTSATYPTTLPPLSPFRLPQCAAPMCTLSFCVASILQCVNVQVGSQRCLIFARCGKALLFSTLSAVAAECSLTYLPTISLTSSLPHSFSEWAWH